MRYIDVYLECKGCPVSKWCGTSNSGIKLCNSYDATLKQKIVFNFKKYYKKMRDLIYSIKCFVIVFVAMFLVNVAASAQSFKCEDNNYTAVSKGRSSEQGEKTSYTYTAKNGTTYPIYIKSDGYCYTIRVSEKTGKEYKSPVKEDIARDICAKLNREYTHKSNKKQK